MTSLAKAEKEARQIVNGWTFGAAGIGWVPGSCLVLTPSDMLMVASIAEIFGVKTYSEETIAAALSAHFSGHVLADLGLTFIPVLGWLIKAGVAAAVTKAAGEIIINYFKDRSPYNPNNNKKHSSENDFSFTNYIEPFANLYHDHTIKIVHGVKMYFDVKENKWKELPSDIKNIMS